MHDIEPVFPTGIAIGAPHAAHGGAQCKPSHAAHAVYANAHLNSLSVILSEAKDLMAIATDTLVERP
jgi:hypothetical protein